MGTEETMYEMALSSGLAENEARLYVDVFFSIDTNKDGRISAEELHRVLTELGYQSNVEQTRKMVALVDENSDGMVDFSEFLHMVEKTAFSHQEELDEEEEILLAFKMFDINHDGKINFTELQQTMAKIGQPLTRKEALELFKAMDENGDGVISFREFMTLWNQFAAGDDSDDNSSF